MFGSSGLDELTGWVGELLVAPAAVEDVTAKTATAARLRGWLDAVVADLARAATEFAARGQGAGATSVLQSAGQLSAKEARNVTKRSELLTAAPAAGEALADGAIGAAHVDALARCAGKAAPAVKAALLNKAAELVESAKTMSPESFERHCEDEVRALEDDGGATRHEQQRRQSSLKRWKDKETGMYCGRFALDPERGARVFGALDAEIEQLWSEHPNSKDESIETVLEQLGAQALVNLLGHGHATRRPAADVHVLVDLETLLHDLHRHGICELSDGTNIPVGTARRLACEARVFPVVLGADGEVLDLGREQRRANRAQRRALRAMYRTCAFPDCDVAFDRCEIHHVLPFELWGPSDLANLRPLCWRHHHLVHEGGWGLSIDPRRTVTVTRADGVLHATEELVTVARWRTKRRRGTERPPPPGDTFIVSA